ncbi:MAG: hypothetical protein ACD_49C00009G0020 [uncultured bacterium (gcode 4)]|uniref:Acyltransferase 3 domain-containing protein n=1 Tax=uncultured bacterium (gcode 4) TaxID=1234023 RepID=K2AFL2_9BACT|nr:MAG: hypothetical protein ACD_49C00009G0020 [uncultured bacterium (gcode 4)]
MIKKRNYYISYLKWIAMVFIVLTHLINRSNIKIISGSFFSYFNDLIKIWPLFFLVLSGSLIIIVYSKYDLKISSLRLYKRSLLLLLVYYFFNILKFYTFDFAKEPYYWQFIERNTFNLTWILTFQSYAVPIPILILFSIFLAITPLFLYIVKNFKYNKTIILGIIWFFLILNYGVNLPQNNFTNLLYWIDTKLFSFNLWIVPYLIWIFLWTLGFEKRKKEVLLFFLILSIFFWILHFLSGKTLLLEPNMYPLTLYYTSASFFIMFAFIYIFSFLEKIKSKLLASLLSFLRYIWDNSLWIYIVHWIIIDSTIWIFFPQVKFIWRTVGISTFTYFLYFMKYRFDKHW